MNTDQSIEADIQAKGLTAARVTPADIEATIASEHYFTAGEAVWGAHSKTAYATSPLNLLTFCVLTLRNGFTVTGESACASPENFDAEVGKKIARVNAMNKIWPLLGYQLRSMLATKAEADALRAFVLDPAAVQTPPMSGELQNNLQPMWRCRSGVLDELAHTGELVAWPDPTLEAIAVDLTAIRQLLERRQQRDLMDGQSLRANAADQ